MELGEKIKRLREEQGLTLEELGKRVGVGKSTVRKWENGMIANMRRDKIGKVAKALGVSPAYLMDWPDEAAEQPAPVSPYQAMEEQLVSDFHRLNDTGKLEAVKRVGELTKINEYTAVPIIGHLAPYNEDAPAYLLPNAAHERTDIKVTDEDREADEALIAALRKKKGK